MVSVQAPLKEYLKCMNKNSDFPSKSTPNAQCYTVEK